MKTTCPHVILHIKPINVFLESGRFSMVFPDDFRISVVEVDTVKYHHVATLGLGMSCRI